MPTVDIVIKFGGFWYDRIVYKNINNYAIDLNDGLYRFTFYTENKKGKRYFHEFFIPDFKLIGYHIRRKED